MFLLVGGMYYVLMKMTKCSNILVTEFLLPGRSRLCSLRVGHVSCLCVYWLLSNGPTVRARWISVR